MRLRLVVALVVAGCSGGPMSRRTDEPAAAVSASDPSLIATSVARFRLASPDQARALLGANDAFVAAMGPLDRSLRLSKAAPIDEAAYRAFTAEQALAWDGDERDRARQAVLRVVAQAESRGLALARHAPPEITLVKTTGKEEFGLPHTRATAIVLPADSLRKPGDDLAELVAHELFHVLSRHAAALRAPAYRLIGFERGGALQMPTELAALRLTNPDGYDNDFQLALPHRGELLWVLPFLVSTRPAYDPAVGNFVLDYANFTLLVVTRGGNEAVTSKRTPAGKPMVLEPQGTDYLRCVGRNTQEIIHPDEVMADNFVRVLRRAQANPPDEPTPALVDDFEVLLRTGAAPAARERCRF